MSNGKGGGGQQKPLSRVIELVLKHNPDDFAKWRDDQGVSEEEFNNLAYKRRDEVANLLRAGDKAFIVAVQTLIGLVTADNESHLTADDLSALRSDVFNKTAEAITKAEKKKIEEAEKKSSAKKDEEKFEIHTLTEFLSYIMDPDYYQTALRRITAFLGNLDDAQKKKFAEELKKGDQLEKFFLLADIDDPASQKAMAQVSGWI